MKWNYLALLLLAATFTFSGCNNDDDDNSSNDLVGTWNMIDYTSSGESSTTTFGLTINTTFTGNATNLDYRVTFNDDNTYAVEGSFDLNLNFITEGTPSEQNFMFTDGMANGTYTVSGNTMTTQGEFLSVDVDGMNLNDPGESQEITFSIDGDRLTMTQEASDMVEDPLTGISAMSSSRATTVFERQ